MIICNPDCVTDIPDNDWTKQCNTKTRPGGIAYLTFLKCVPDIEFPNDTGEESPWTNIDNVTWAICQGFLYVSAPVLGQKPKGTFTKRRLSSCAPEVTVSGSKTVTFQDYNADNDNLLDFDFWSAIVANKKFMYLGWVACGPDGSDLWYQTTKPWDIELDEVREDTNDGLAFKDGALTIPEMDLIKPILVSGLIDTFGSFLYNYDC